MSKRQSDYPTITGYSDKVAPPPPGKPPRQFLLVCLVVAGLLGMAGAWWGLRKGDLPVEGPGTPPAVAKAGTEEKESPSEPEIPDLPGVPPTPPDDGGDGPERPACFGGARVVVQAPAHALAYLGKTSKRLRVGTDDWTKVPALPHTLTRQPCGLADLGLEAAGFEVKPPVRPVLIQEGRTNEFSFTVTAKPAALLLTCNVANAVVELEGKKTSVGGTLSVPSLQSLALTVTAPLHRRQNLDLGPYDPLSTPSVAVTLEREAGTLVIEVEAPAQAADYLKAAGKRVKIGTGEWAPVSALPHTTTNLGACVATPVELEVAGFEIAGGAPAAPVVRDGRSTTVKFVLAPQPAMLRLTCNVTNAVVEIAGKMTPVGGPLPVPALSPLELTVRAPGHVPQMVKLGPMNPGKTYQREVKLELDAMAVAAPAGKEWKSPATGMAFVFIKPGTFQMGSPVDEKGRYDNETRHEVTLTRGYWLGKSEVTQKQWQAVMGSNPSRFKGDDLPVENVSWNDCQAFIKKLCEQEGVPPGSYRLPTEAEWEYACRAGTTGAYGGKLEEMAWTGNNSGGKTHPVGQKKPNAWGLYDMHGNVWEWCSDWYRDYSPGSVTDPTGPGPGSERVERGGSWGLTVAGYFRAAHRNWGDPALRSGGRGFRLVRAVY